MNTHIYIITHIYIYIYMNIYMCYYMLNDVKWLKPQCFWRVFYDRLWSFWRAFYDRIWSSYIYINVYIYIYSMMFLHVLEDSPWCSMILFCSFQGIGGRQFSMMFFDCLSSGDFLLRNVLIAMRWIFPTSWACSQCKFPRPVVHFWLWR